MWFSVDTGRKLNVHKTPKTSSERLMYVQFTSCVYGVCIILTLRTAAFICIRNGQKKLINMLKISYVLLIGGAMMVSQTFEFQNYAVQFFIQK